MNVGTEQSPRWLAPCSNTVILKKFWAETVNTAVYLLNRSPTVAVKGKTSEKAWSGHLKVFGSLASIWILDASRTKLDGKSPKLMLVGYNNLHKAQVA